MVDHLSRFNISTDGVIRLAADTKYALWFNVDELVVGVKEYQPHNPAPFAFNVSFMFCK